MSELSFRINGTQRTVVTKPMNRLLDVIREELLLTGTKEGCGEGACGACSVILDGELVNSCLIPAAQTQGSSITTIEGIGAKTLNAIQTSFLKCGGAQCGICTPGMIIAAFNLLKSSHKPNVKAIREHLAGNLCRCTGYQQIIESVAKTLRKVK